MPSQLPDGTWISDDDLWRLIGGNWRPLPARVADSRPGLFWFKSSPGWLAAAIIMGLIALIPVVGLMNLYGWSLATAANLRAGYRLAAPTGLGYIGRGAGYFLWSCLAGLIVFTLATAAGAGAGFALHSARHDWAWTIAVGLASFWTVTTAFHLVLTPLAVPVLRLIDDEGFGAALSPRRLGRALSQNWDVAWYGALALIIFAAAYAAANLIGNLIPVLGPIAAFAFVIPAYGALGLLLAAPLARARSRTADLQPNPHQPCRRRLHRLPGSRPGERVGDCAGLGCRCEQLSERVGVRLPGRMQLQLLGPPGDDHPGLV